MPGLGGRGQPRFVEHFAAALDRLGDPRPAQRVGALRTLAALGQSQVDQRSAIVDVFCAYLRTPGDDEAVRRVAVAILAEHLRPEGSGYWAGVSLDLARAQLADLDLSGCRVEGHLRLDGAVLTGQAKLRGLSAGTASLRGTTFADHTWLERSVFMGAVAFDGAVFQGDAWFGEASFGGWTTFGGVDFGGHAWFGGCTFRAPVDFNHAVFRRSAGFRGAVTHAGVGLGGTTFLGPARVSRRDEGWNLLAPGWRVVVDPDNASVGNLLWVGHPELVDTPEAASDTPTAIVEAPTQIIP